jgi:hypothetical protein
MLPRQRTEGEREERTLKLQGMEVDELHGGARRESRCCSTATASGAEDGGAGQDAGVDGGAGRD